MDGLTLRLENAARFPQPDHRALEIAVAIPTAAWKTLRVSHSDNRPGDDGKKGQIGLGRETESVTHVPGLKCYPCSRLFAGRLGRLEVLGVGDLEPIAGVGQAEKKN